MGRRTEDDIYGPSVSTAFLHYDGTTWGIPRARCFTPSGAKPNLSGVWGSGASDVWAVGSGVVMHCSGPKPENTKGVRREGDTRSSSLRPRTLADPRRDGVQRPKAAQARDESDASTGVSGRGRRSSKASHSGDTSTGLRRQQPERTCRQAGVAQSCRRLDTSRRVGRRQRRRRPSASKATSSLGQEGVGEATRQEYLSTPYGAATRPISGQAEEKLRPVTLSVQRIFAWDSAKKAQSTVRGPPYLRR